MIEYDQGIVTTIKQRVTVGAGGSVAIHSNELHEGESAEIIVMVERATETGSDDRLRALQDLRSRLALSADVAAVWEYEVRSERSAARELPTSR
jgi:hypothetical protein